MWRLLHVDTGDFQPTTQEGCQREARVLTIMARIKWLRATMEGLQLRCVPGEPPLSWPATYKYLCKVYHTEMQGRDAPLFHQFWSHVVEQLRGEVRRGVQPLLDEGTLQAELRDAAMAQVNHLWLHAIQQQPAAAASKGRRCMLCHSTGHTMKDHPADQPITVPCLKCKALHAMTGPLKTPCPN